MQFNIALNYGGRAEIVEAARRMLADGVPPDELDEARFSRYLYTAGQPDPDLLIRTSGEMRVSNFLLWQIAYAEIWVTDTLWPDFRQRHLLEAIVAYQKRDRRYGGINAAGGRRPVTQRPAAQLPPQLSSGSYDARPQRARPAAGRHRDDLVPAAAGDARSSPSIAAVLAFVEYAGIAAALGAPPCRRRRVVLGAARVAGDAASASSVSGVAVPPNVVLS